MSKLQPSKRLSVMETATYKIKDVHSGDNSPYYQKNRSESYPKPMGDSDEGVDEEKYEEEVY